MNIRYIGEIAQWITSNLLQAFLHEAPQCAKWQRMAIIQTQTQQVLPTRFIWSIGFQVFMLLTRLAAKSFAAKILPLKLTAHFLEVSTLLFPSHFVCFPTVEYVPISRAFYL